jgi:hypothetical protein
MRLQWGEDLQGYFCAREFFLMSFAMKRREINPRKRALVPKKCGFVYDYVALKFSSNHNVTISYSRWVTLLNLPIDFWERSF